MSDRRQAELNLITPAEIRMKQCPQCLESYNDDESFCELDGSALVDNIDSIRDALVTGPPTQRNASGLVTGIIGALAGAIICLLLYIVFLLSLIHISEPTR